MKLYINPKVEEALEWLLCIIIAIIISLVVKYFIGTPTKVKHESMYPTLQENQRLWLNRWGKTTKKMPERGDIITFEAPSVTFPTSDKIDSNSPKAIYNNEPKSLWKKFSYYVLETKKTSYIKRVIALPGEHVQIKEGKIYINEEQLDESSYLREGVITNVPSNGFNDFTVPEKYIFAVGDNRNHSTDCREFGCIPLEKIESKVAIRIWPLNLFGKV